MEMNLWEWDHWVQAALSKLQTLKVLRSLRPIYVSSNELQKEQPPSVLERDDDFEVFDEMQPWDRSAVEISISDSTFHRWLHDIPSSGSYASFHCLTFDWFHDIFMWFFIILGFASFYPLFFSDDIAKNLVNVL